MIGFPSSRSPRTRGDVPATSIASLSACRPPCTRRGVPDRGQQPVIGPIVRPAHGSVPGHASGFASASTPALHCTRGGAPIFRGSVNYDSMSAPHTRECSSGRGHQCGPEAVRPAHAGVFPRASRSALPCCRPSRTRGGVPASSPVWVRPVARPAHAGLLRGRVLHAPTSHGPPRTRGVTVSGPGVVGLPSSPLAWTASGSASVMSPA
jgi:hypothetical protein